jgi:hypothetical protein
VIPSHRRPDERHLPRRGIGSSISCIAVIGQ